MPSFSVTLLFPFVIVVIAIVVFIIVAIDVFFFLTSLSFSKDSHVFLTSFILHTVLAFIAVASSLLSFCRLVGPRADGARGSLEIGWLFLEVFSNLLFHSRHAPPFFILFLPFLTRTLYIYRV